MDFLRVLGFMQRGQICRDFCSQELVLGKEFIKGSWFFSLGIFFYGFVVKFVGFLGESIESCCLSCCGICWQIFQIFEILYCFWYVGQVCFIFVFVDI